VLLLRLLFLCGLWWLLLRLLLFCGSSTAPQCIDMLRVTMVTMVTMLRVDVDMLGVAVLRVAC